MQHVIYSQSVFYCKVLKVRSKTKKRTKRIRFFSKPCVLSNTQQIPANLVNVTLLSSHELDLWSRAYIQSVHVRTVSTAAVMIFAGNGKQKREKHEEGPELWTAACSCDMGETVTWRMLALHLLANFVCDFQTKKKMNTSPHYYIKSELMLLVPGYSCIWCRYINRNG